MARDGIATDAAGQPAQGKRQPDAARFCGREYFCPGRNQPEQFPQPLFGKMMQKKIGEDGIHRLSVHGQPRENISGGNRHLPAQRRKFAACLLINHIVFINQDDVNARPLLRKMPGQLQHQRTIAGAEFHNSCECAALRRRLQQPAKNLGVAQQVIEALEVAPRTGSAGVLRRQFIQQLGFNHALHGGRKAQ